MSRIGILNFTRVARSGGGFQYVSSLLEGLRGYSQHDIVVFYDDPAYRKFCFDSPSFKWICLQENELVLAKVVRGISTLLGIRSPVLGRYRELHKHNLDLLVSFDSIVGFHLGIPFLSFVGDVMYRYFPSLPEYTLRERTIRNLTAKMLTRHAECTVVDSQQSQEDLMRFFNVERKRIQPIPLCPPPHIYAYADLQEPEIQEVLKKYRLPPRFIFYPAQFWAHKNHVRLIRALEILRRGYGCEIPAVFVGAAWESFDGAVSLIRELKMEEQVHCLGYLPEKEIVALYRKATALVFASFADYTNIPVLEAMALGTPIVCSNMFSMPEQVREAGLFFDPFNTEDMAKQILRVWSDESLRAQLSAHGLRRAKELSLENFAKAWNDLIQRVLQNGKR